MFWKAFTVYRCWSTTQRFCLRTSLIPRRLVLQTVFAGRIVKAHSFVQFCICHEYVWCSAQKFLLPLILKLSSFLTHSTFLSSSQPGPSSTIEYQTLSASFRTTHEIVKLTRDMCRLFLSHRGRLHAAICFNLDSAFDFRCIRQTWDSS